jgi:hypothetical protein
MDMICGEFGKVRESTSVKLVTEFLEFPRKFSEWGMKQVPLRYKTYYH